MFSESRYAKPELLYRLCKTVGNGIYGTLKAYNDVHRKGSKQWQLFEYYRALPHWDSDQEKLDWAGENLKVLKHRTLKWLLKSMSRVASWPNRDLIELIGEISWGIKEGAGEYLFELTKTAKEIARSREAFHLLEEVLRLEMQAVQALDFAGFAGQIAKDNLEERQIVALIKQEIAELLEIRILYLESWRESAKADGRIMRTNSDLLHDTLLKINPEALRSCTARLEYEDMSLKSALLKGQIDDATLHSDRIGALYSDYPWLAAYDFGRFFSHLLNRIAAYALSGKLDIAISLVSEFDIRPDLGEGNANLAAMPKLKAYFYLYEITLDQGFAKTALDLYRHALINQTLGEPQNQIQIGQFAAAAALDLGLYTNAIDALEEIIRYKSELSPIRIAHARIMLLIAYLGARHDQEFLFGQFLNCNKFIKRQKNTPTELEVIVRSIGKLIKRLGTYVDARIVANQLIDYLNDLPSQESKEVKIDYRYAKWIDLAVKSFQ
jgi:hypothetical protein